MSWRWRGRNWQGRAQSGHTVKTPAVFAKQQYQRGFTWLTVVDDNGEQVAGITSDGKGGREWWAHPIKDAS